MRSKKLNKDDMTKRLDSLEKRFEKLENIVKKSDKRKISHVKSSDEFSGLAGAINDLIETTFFDKPKKLFEIKKQVEANGYFHPVTAYPNTLLRLVRKRKIRRLDINGKWEYVKYG